MVGEHDAPRPDAAGVAAGRRRVRGNGEKTGEHGITDRHGGGSKRRGGEGAAGDDTDRPGGSAATGAGDPDRATAPIRVAGLVPGQS